MLTMHTDTEEIPGTAEESTKKKFTYLAVLDPASLTRDSRLVRLHEVELMQQCVRDVHKAGYVGETWPQVQTVLLRRDFEGWHELTGSHLEVGSFVHEYHVRVWVTAVPR